jgi:DNA polymerase III alpha subunit
VYLNCHTGFSFKYGTLPIKTLFEEAKRCGVHKLALTEINNVSSYLDMLRICEENKPAKDGLTKYGKTPYQLDIAVGIEFRNDHELIYIVIARNNRGFETINRFFILSQPRRKKNSQTSPRV